MIVHRVIDKPQDDYQLTSSYLNFQQIPSHKKIHAPEPYSNERSQSYSLAFEKTSR